MNKDYQECPKSCQPAPNPVDQCHSTISAMRWLNPRDLIDRQIDFLNRSVEELLALRRSLPGEMPPQAERSLVDILNRAWPELHRR